MDLQPPSAEQDRPKHSAFSLFGHAVRWNYRIDFQAVPAERQRQRRLLLSGFVVINPSWRLMTDITADSADFLWCGDA